MKRRDFILAVGGSVVLPFAGRAQERVRRIGILLNFTGDQERKTELGAFRKRLSELGWNERSVTIDERWGAGDVDRLRSYAAELVSLKPDIMLTGPTPATAAAQQATRTIPIVFVGANNPVGSGFVQSLARPGGNITGFIQLEPSMGGKWLEALKEIAPSVTRVGLVHNPQTHTGQYFPAIETASQRMGVALTRLPYGTGSDLERGLGIFAGEPHGGLLVLPDSSNTVHRNLLVSLTLKYRLPAISSFRDFATNGGLAYYGVERTDQYSKAAEYVDRILRGAKPADLPVQGATRYELVINLKTAKAFGIDVPASLQQRADEVIE